MRAIVVGLGSMGRRRIRLLSEYDETIDVVGVDTLADRRKQAEEELKIKTCLTIEDACRMYNVDIAFVSTSPASHSSIIRECIERNLHVFTEINLILTDYDENIALARKKNKTLFLSSTFQYRKEIEYIKESVQKCDCTLSYLYHTGQYLPDWHPWESYKDFFVSKKETNGCREIMAIEFPWLIDVFGEIKSFFVTKGKDSNLDIDFPDTYSIVFEHKTGHRGLILVDVVSRKASRNFELSGERLYLTWDGTPDGLSVYDCESKKEKRVELYEKVNKRNDYSATIIEDAYFEEIKNFIETVKGVSQPRYSFEKDKKVLSIIDDIENEKRGKPQ